MCGGAIVGHGRDVSFIDFALVLNLHHPAGNLADLLERRQATVEHQSDTAVRISCRKDVELDHGAMAREAIVSWQAALKVHRPLL